MIVATFYTKEYEQQVGELKKTVKYFDLKFDAMQIEDRGNWRLNLGYRPTFILKMLDKHKEPILAVDADARFRQKPTILLANPPCDIAFFYSPKWDLASGGTLYFNNTEIARSILKEWMELEKKLWQTTMNDQFTLRQVVCGESHWGIHSTRLLLPASYLCIKRSSSGYFTAPPVIEHLIIGSKQSIKMGGKAKPSMRELGLPRCDKSFLSRKRLKELAPITKQKG